MLQETKKQNDFVMWVYAYIHSGVALSTKSFCGRLPQGHAEFDSGICGVIIVRQKKFLEEFGGEKWTPPKKKHAEDICENDIKTFQAYLNGEVYGYVIDDHAESCGGYYTVKEAMEEAKLTVDFLVKEDKEKHCTQLKKWIKHSVPLDKRQSMAQVTAV